MAGEELFFVLGFIFSSILAIGMFAIVFLLTLTTPCWAYLKAKMKKQPILNMHRRDMKSELVVGEYCTEGMVMSKKRKACFIVDNESAFVDSKSGVTVLDVNGEVGITLTPKILGIIAGLKSMGLQNLDDAIKMNSLYGVCKVCGYEGFCEPVFDKTGETPIFIRLKCPYEGEEETNVQEKGDTAKTKAAS